MNPNVYSNTEFTKLKEQINQEIQRRGTYKWWDPLTLPAVGQDRTPPLSIPDCDNRMQIDENTYTINNPSVGSIEPTRNIHYPPQGENPGGQDPDKLANVPNTSAAQVNMDEMRNYLVGLAKINDINLFYGRDEINFLAFRNPNNIEESVKAAQASELNSLLKDSDIFPTKIDPLTGQEVAYPMEDGQYVIPSGEYDGEELKRADGLGPGNFYDDYGAEPGDSNYHPYNRMYTSPAVHRDLDPQGHNRDLPKEAIIRGGVKSFRFGPNPRNPENGDPYPSIPAYGGKKGSCQAACTGLCYMTCDNQCSESCEVTCWNRCGNACTNSCGNSCSGCSSQCLNTCKTKCENITGYSCLKAGAKTVSITTTGGKKGEPAKNNLSYTTYTCQGCSYSCQFYPNKKTECWDSGCMGKCFITCNTACSTTCYGGCIDNASDKNEDTSYHIGKGRGCSSGCTLNCIGTCLGVCEGQCIQTCWHSCLGLCSDNCSYECVTACGHACTNGCTTGCTGCYTECTNECVGGEKSTVCSGCSSEKGCMSTCQFACNRNCVGFGCRSLCGIDSISACEANCRLSCTGTSCTAMCSDACSDQCTTCVNSCGFQCGMCSSKCSTGCSSACNITCTESCSSNCDDNCVTSCNEECGGCSNLCYSCTGMCIGVCSVKCENGCSLCAGKCTAWCDVQCNRACFASCDSFCIDTCSGSCISYLSSETTTAITGPEREPTAEGYIYPNPKNRWEERESFKLFHDIPRYKLPVQVHTEPVVIAMIPNKYFVVIELHRNKVTERIQRVRDINKEHMLITTNTESFNITEDTPMWKYGDNQYKKIHIESLYVNDFIYIWDVDTLGNYDMPFDHDDTSRLSDDRNMIVTCPVGVKYHIIQTTINGGVYNVDANTGEIVINPDMLSGQVENNQPNILTGGGIFAVVFEKDSDPIVTADDIEYILPFGFILAGTATDKEGNFVVVIKRDEFKYPEMLEDHAPWAK